MSALIAIRTAALYNLKMPLYTLNTRLKSIDATIGTAIIVCAGRRGDVRSLDRLHGTIYSAKY